MPFVGPPLHQHVSFRHRAAPVSVSLRPSTTVAAWQPGPATPFRGKASVRLVCARLHPRPGNARRCSCRLPGSQPLLAIARDSLCLPLVVPFRLRRERHAPNILAISFGVNRPGLRHAGSHLAIFRHFLLTEEQPPPPSAGTGRCWGAPHPNKFLPIHWPIRQ